jgi:hypothetical protein
MDIFQNLLNTVRAKYKEADKDLSLINPVLKPVAVAA